MRRLIEKFWGVIFFYLAIIGTVIAVNYRFAELNEIINDEQLAYIISE